MNCHCCDAAVSLARRVVILDLVADVEQNPSSPYRTAFVCQTCYEALDTTDGVGEVAGLLHARQSLPVREGGSSPRRCTTTTGGPRR